MAAPKGHKPYNKNGEGGCPPTRWTPEVLENLATKFEEWMNQPNSIWYEQFCLENDFLPDQLTEFAKRNERFNQVYRKSQTWQKTKLITQGLTNQYNPSFTKFVMSNTCGWTDKSQIAGDPTSPLIGMVLGKIDGMTKEIKRDTSDK
jgi:hypothetical protein